MKNSDDLWDIPNVCINLYALYWGAFLYNGVYNQRTFKIIICKTHFLNKYIHYGLKSDKLQITTVNQSPERHHYDLCQQREPEF